MKRNQHSIGLVLLISFVISSITNALGASTLEIKDNWYYLNGRKFFIKAIGYEIGARPGQNPYQGVRADDLDLMRFDLKVIKEGGYNAIRTWSQFSEPQLKLVQASGLKLIMGIEVNPDGDYGDPVFVRKCEDSLKRVLAYARNYDCIITYLVLNEPQTDHLHKMTGKSFVNLMQRLMGIIHQEHPGIPVTISANAMISDFLDENIFDVYAYNCYDPAEAQTATMGFKDFIRGLYELNGRKKPLITTEFGYSVSRQGEGRYGGNTLTQQRDGLIANYRNLIDAGAVGMCPFYYADGWWKGGDPMTHSLDQPEEWFGFWGYRDASDKHGSPRPVWFAMRDYMKALIISPKNISIHTNNTVPLELYTDADVRKVVVKVNDRVVYSQTLTNDGYFADQLSLSPNGIEDMELAFEFYGKNDKLLKTESILILASSAAFDLPRLSGVGSTNLSPSSTTAYVLTGTRTTAALGTEIVKATNVVGLVPGVASNWSLVDNFDFYNPGFLAANGWWADVGAGGVKSVSVVAPTNCNRLAKTVTSASGAYLKLNALTVNSNQSRTLFFRLIPTGEFDASLLRHYVGITDRPGNFDFQYKGGNIGPAVQPTVNDSTQNPGDWLLAARDIPYSALTFATNILQTGAVYNVWIDVTNVFIGDRVFPDNYDTFSVHLQKEGEVGRTTLFTNFYSDRDLLSDDPLTGGLPTDPLNRIYLCGSRTEYSALFDDFYLSKSGYNDTVPRAVGYAGLLPTLRIEWSGSQWQVVFQGKLEEASSVNGTWSEVSGATLPYPLTTTGDPRFFRAINN